MSTQSSNDARTWTGHGLILLVVLMPALTEALVADHRSVMTAAADADGLTIAPAALVAAVCLYAAWRLTPTSCPAWMVGAISLLGLKAVSRAGLQLADPERTAAQHVWMAVLDVVQLVVTVGFILVDRRRLFRRSPAAWGAGAGLLLGLLRVVAVRRLPVVDPAPAFAAVELAVVIALAAVVARAVLRAHTVIGDVRVRLLAGVLLLTAGRASDSLAGAVHEPLPDLLGLLLTATGSVALVTGGLRLLRVTLTEQSRRTSALRRQLELAEAEDRLRRAQMHEIESTMAGIVSASDLLRDGAAGTADRRRQLEEMVDAELHRLERLLRDHDPFGRPAVPAPRRDGGTTRAGEAVDLDRMIEALAVVHEAKGTAVEWRPSGQWASAGSDDVAEVLNILLDNAARHGDATASVQVQTVPEGVEILVSDNGPGIAPEVRDRLFEWGARGPASPGQGIGLHIAASLASKHGGYLRLHGSERHPSGRRVGHTGATFVVGLPIAEARRGILA